MGTLPSDKTLPPRTNSAWERTILGKFSILITMPAKTNQKPTSHTTHLIGMACGLVLFTAAAFIARSNGLSVIETRFFHYFYDLPIGLRSLLLAITQFGSIFALITVVLVAWAQHKKQLAGRLAVAGLSSFLLVNVTKTVNNSPYAN